ncbi:MAG: winged helix DNA-binding protein [Coleofasciculaceae cyanobacterium RL_1_1]|nr:winged helix DNA-binding protein [Coleofasciculaceae cyanobacterium RL_1_1]
MNDAEELQLLFKAVHRESERRLSEALAPLDITPAQAEALIVLQMAQPISLGDLGDLLVAEGGHPSRLVDRLVRNRWVDRSVSADDRRRLVLSLTPEGVALAERIKAVRGQLCEDKRSLLDRIDISSTLALFEGYLQGSPWWQTVERRRALGRDSSIKPLLDSSVDPSVDPFTEMMTLNDATQNR